ncbi:precorrin-3B synthase [Actinomadura parmotrematis]|uniref:Precorrin-3B synthase n=1 Tax=Actinomadura parmotrematis TaxID=2864039 RepID=A0ABS7FP21_9ACTN|nr:precorrin-3B synthase [Actinomadura parmotrematis]MBW8482144.1 precorrin-3B synthase [Actinomadura parmotrematis]
MSPSSRSGPDACPGALRVHRAADGGLARVRLPGGVLRAEGLAALADAAAEWGDGHLELTSRGNVQLRGLPDGVEAELAARLRDGGLLPSATHETVRNIVASPLSGRDGRGLIDVRPLTRALDAALCADPALAALSGRFLFALDDGRGDVVALRADAALLAVAEDVFALVVAGRDSGVRVSPEGAEKALLDVARAFLRARGSEWRIKELDDPVAALAPHLPPPTADPRDVPRAPARPDIGPVRQLDGRTALCALVPLGRLDPAPLRGRAEVVVTPWRTLAIPDLADVSDSFGLVADPASGWAGLTACAGRPGCAKALTDVRADAARTRTDGAEDGALPVHWSGCERQCGRPAAAHVAVVATEDGYEVRRGGEVRARGHDLAATAASVARQRRNQ